MEKKGDLTITMLVTIIVSVVGFIVLIVVFSQVLFPEQIDNDVCHASVVLRGTLPDTAGISKSIPLQCATTLNCVTSGIIGSKCDYTNSNVKKVKVSSRTQVEKFLATEVVDAWNVFGQGKILVFPDWLTQGYSLGGAKSACAIYSRVKFDSELEKTIGAGELSRVDVLNYMLTHKVPNGNTSYYEYLTGQKDSVAKLSVDKFSITNDDGKTKTEVDLVQGTQSKENPKELAVVFMQIATPDYSEVFKNDLKVVGYAWGTSFATSPIKTLQVTKSLANVYVAGIAALIVGGQMAMTYFNQEVTAGYCGDVTYGDKTYTGCSVVRVMNYNYTEIQKYCGYIETIG
jgi:hypothetical protein